MKVVLFSRTMCVLLGSILCARVAHGTEPVPQELPCLFDFSTWDASSTNYPLGIMGWRVAAESSSKFSLASALSDALLKASSSASETSGGAHNYTGKLGILDTSSGAYALACALCTKGQMNIRVTFDIMTLRNPFNGTSNTRTNECGLFYRVGTSGDFTFAGISYTNTATQQITGTTPQNPQTLTIKLPSACNAQAVVQLRWSARDLTGGGSRPSFALGRIAVSGDVAPNTLTPPQNIRKIAISATSLHFTWDPVPSATAYALDLYACLETPRVPIFQEDFNAFDGASNTSLENVLDDYTRTNGWTGQAVYEAAGCVRLGNSSTRGWLQTPLVTAPGKCSLTFEAQAWDHEEEATSIDAYCIQGATTNLLQTLYLSKTNRQSYVIQAEVQGECRFGLTARQNTRNRFFVDNLSLCPGWQNQTLVTNNMITTENRVCFQGLRAGVLYKGVIRAINGSEQSANSAEFSAKTFNATLILLN
jgi:hypothetical protein